MKQRVTTVNGSVYVIDYDTRTWCREESTDRSGFLRTGGKGKFLKVSPPAVGEHMLIQGPPVDPAMLRREILTSVVTRVEETS